MLMLHAQGTQVLGVGGNMVRDFKSVSHAAVNSADAILAASPDCIKILSSDGVVRFINERGLELIEGSSASDVLGRQYADLWPKEMRPHVVEAIERAANGETTHVEGFCPTLKGSPRWWEANFQGVKGSAGIDTEVIGIARDISDRRARELLLKSNVERYARFVDSSGDGICESSAEGLCTFMNPAGASMLGYTPEELIGTALHATILHHKADGSEYPADESPIATTGNSGIAVRIVDQVFWHKDGHAVPTCYSVHPIDSRDRKRGVVVIFKDDTEQKIIAADVRRLAAELSKANQRTTEFIATLAHELRNPLAPIRTGLQLMRKAGDNATAVGHVREMMERQVGQMAHLIGDLLDIARVTSGKMKLKKERIDLHSVLESALEASASLIATANHSLSVHAPPEPLFVRGDITRLSQVFTNLLNNAAKYTTAGGRISVTVSRANGQVVIDVSDSGIGMTQASLLPIFDMFTKVGRDIEGAQGGLGIGLNLVRRLVELHDGRVIATSEGLGRGSHFVVTLPMASSTEHHCEAAMQPPVSKCKDPQRIRVLLVDDNADAAATLALLLELEEHTTRVANSGAEALRIVTEFKPDIVFLDIGMPGMNGYDVARAIRKMPEAGNPLLVALTGWGGEADRLRSKSAGFDEHLTKPADIVTIERLLSTLDAGR